MIVRPAQLEDAEGIANVHVKSWQTTYTGIIPDEVIQSRNMENRTTIWTRILTNSNQDNVLLVAEDNGEIMGFVHGGAPQDPIDEFDSEVYAIYLLQEAQGKGIGRQLMQACAEELHEKGHQSLMLWVLKGNDDSQGFYEYMGGELFAEGSYNPTETISLKTLGYGWNNIRTLLAEG